MTLPLRTLGLAVLGLFVFIAGCDIIEDVIDDDPLPERYVIPGDDVFPEGIALDEHAGIFYVGSVADGTIYRGTLRRDTLRAFSETLPTAVGLALDRGRLWVAGGPAGQAFTLSRADGALETTFSAPAPPAGDSTFINDVALAADAAYFTDSFRPVLFRAAPTAEAEVDLEPWLDLTGTPIAYEAGFNLNGIASTPGGQYLLVVQSNTGRLFRIEIATQDVQPVDLGGDTLANGDGILLPEAHTLYVAQNADGVVTPVELSADYLSGDVGASFGGDAPLRFPTTLAEKDGSLFVVNGQLDEQGPDGNPVLPFTVSRIEIPH